jgi:hypothetical protein
MEGELEGVAAAMVAAAGLLARLILEVRALERGQLRIKGSEVGD